MKFIKKAVYNISKNFVSTVFENKNEWNSRDSSDEESKSDFQVMRREINFLRPPQNIFQGLHLKFSINFI